MKINKIANVSRPVFKSCEFVRDDYGQKKLFFGYPFDKDNEICEIHVYRAIPAENYTFKRSEQPTAIKEIKENGSMFSPGELGLGENEPLMYQVVRKNKDTKQEIWRGADLGTQVNPLGGRFFYNQRGGTSYNNSEERAAFKPYNHTLVTQNVTTPKDIGLGSLSVPDTVKPGLRLAGFNEENTGEIIEDETVQLDAENSVRTFSNVMGGNYAGLMAQIEDDKEMGVRYKFTTPMINGDNVSYHLYWPENNFQTCPRLGSKEDFNLYMRKLFDAEQTYVYDSTITSEGMQGIHIQHALNNLEDPYFRTWFKMQGTKNSPIGLGVIPEDSTNIRFRIVNSPVNYKQDEQGRIITEKNHNYRADRETYFQIYDKTMVTDEQLKDTSRIITAYAKRSPKDKLATPTHNETAIPYHFLVEPEMIIDRINVINEFNKGNKNPVILDSGDSAEIFGRFPHFRITKKTEGNIVTWDANTDMFKHQTFVSVYDEKQLEDSYSPEEKKAKLKELLIGAYGVQDYHMQAMRYVFQDHRNNLTLHIAQKVGDRSTYKQIKTLNLPKSAELNENVINNLKNEEYNLSELSDLKKDDITLKAIMSFPFEALELNKTTLGLLATPYFTNRPFSEEQVGLTRFELAKENNPQVENTRYKGIYNKTNKLLEGPVKLFTDNVINKLNETSSEKLLDDSGNYTEYGEYVVNIFAPIITRYALLKAIGGENFKAKTRNIDKQITFDADLLRETTSLRGLGIYSKSQETKAESLYSVMKNGLSKLSADDVKFVSEAIGKQLEGTTTLGFRIAEATYVRSGKGLGIREDAIKDTADQDAVRNRDEYFAKQHEQFQKYSKRLHALIREINPSAYIVAEITNIPDLMRDTTGHAGEPYEGKSDHGGIYNGEPDAMIKYLLDASVNTEAGYPWTFSSVQESVSVDFEKGKDTKNHYSFLDRVMLMARTRPQEYTRLLYSFVGNHDKPRLLHCLALDMELASNDRPLTHNSFEFDQNADLREKTMIALTGAKSIGELPLEFKLNIHNNEYFYTISREAVSMGHRLIETIYNDLDNKIISDSDKSELAKSVADLVNGKVADVGEVADLYSIKIPELSSVEGAFGKILEFAEKHGLKLSESEKQSLTKEIIKETSKDHYANDFAIRGGFEWNGNLKFKDGGVVNFEKYNRDNLKYVVPSSKRAITEYNTYSVAIARMLKKAFYELPKSKEGNIEACIMKGIADFVEQYDNATVKAIRKPLPVKDSPRMAERKDAFGTRDIQTAIEMAVTQYEFRTGKVLPNKDTVIKELHRIILEPAVAKGTMIMKTLVALPGIVTNYSGDEIGMTGKETPCKNQFAQNRNTLRDKTALNADNIKKEMLESMKGRSTEGLEALNDGLPYELDVDTSVGVRALLRQNAKGDAVVALFDLAGVDPRAKVNYFKKFGLDTEEKRKQFFKDNNVYSMNPNNPYIPIQEEKELEEIVLPVAIGVAVGTVFQNIDNPLQKLIAERRGDVFVLKNKGEGKIKINGKNMKQGVGFFKKLSPAFKGRQINKQYNIPVNAYSKINNVEQGKNLSIVAG